MRVAKRKVEQATSSLQKDTIRKGTNAIQQHLAISGHQHEESGTIGN